MLIVIVAGHIDLSVGSVMGFVGALAAVMVVNWEVPIAVTMATCVVVGALIGGAGGALQAASRTMMVRHTTADKATEGFGLYALSGKATAFLAPFLIATVTDLTGNQRIGISPLIAMFLLALVLLGWVKPEGEAKQ